MTTEGLKRPGETATAVVTIRNNVGVPTRSAVAVFPGTLHPLGGGAFNADVFTPLVFTDTVQTGAVATLRAPLTLPPSISEGSAKRCGSASIRSVPPASW